jgi:hypothetical protein
MPAVAAMTVSMLQGVSAGVEQASMEETAECPDASGVSGGYGDRWSRGQRRWRMAVGIRDCVGAGAGEVVEVGRNVTRFKPGDRVISAYFPRWIDGGPAPWKMDNSPAAQVDGVLAERFVVDEPGLVPIPAHLSYDEASTLSCVGITAWNALFADGNAKPGSTVVLLGTGGLSICALQLAHVAGLRTVITSSSNEKLERARQLGADETINDRATPEWQNEVLRLTDGVGADIATRRGTRRPATVAVGRAATQPDSPDGRDFHQDRSTACDRRSCRLAGGLQRRNGAPLRETVREPSAVCQQTD